MSTTPQKRDADTPPVQTATFLLKDIADTSWRMFVPTIGATILGLVIDKVLHTTPWIMIISILIGCVLAGLLVRAQLNKVKQTS